jgi:hypothetical protein
VVRKLIADDAIQRGEAQGRAQKADVTTRKSTPR